MNNTDIIAIIIAFVAASPGILSLYRQYKNDQKAFPQTLASEGLKASETAVSLVRQYSDEISKVKLELREIQSLVDSLRTKLVEQGKLIDEMSVGIERLCGQIISLGQKPVWTPEDLIEKIDKEDK
jgi:hypothetical protein